MTLDLQDLSQTLNGAQKYFWPYSAAYIPFLCLSVYLITYKIHFTIPLLFHAFCSSTEHKTRGAGLCMPPAGGRKAWPGCLPAGASCGRYLHPPELLHSCRADHSAAADKCAAAFPAPPQRTLDIALALHCPDRHTGNKFTLVCFSETLSS